MSKILMLAQMPAQIAVCMVPAALKRVLPTSQR
eukprot:CAMPEP_0119504142 /NCGR_PEP_ID=MMETSP1344-20130328/25092_1 /TAXON_ID=236787 /ORGANISM="Florenciella parvula, Strain CCMP2471" /LENGTH=32 /DNA_ID= /DNA_START= /DNA_END= /DNA_ORIENTATION=